MRPQDKRILYDLADWQLFGLNIEREAGGEPEEGKIAVGTVVLERIDHRKWDGNTMQTVILKPWQFSWTMPEAGEAYYREAVQIAAHWIDEFRARKALQECCRIGNGMLQGVIPRDPDLASCHCCQYLNPDVAGETKAKWLKAGLRVVKVIGNHEFFV